MPEHDSSFWKRFLRGGVLLALFVLFSISAFGLSIHIPSEPSGSGQQSSAPAPATAEDLENLRQQTEQNGLLDSAAAAKINPDIVGWLEIPGTGISQPVLQSKLSDAIYQMTSPLGAISSIGSVYLPASADGSFSSPMTMICSLSNPRGELFSALHYFEDRQFFEEHPSLYLYTGQGKREYRIFAAYRCSLEQEALFAQPELSEEALRMIGSVTGDTAHYRPDFFPGADSSCLTLSTNFTGRRMIRWIVQAVLIQQ